jgi:excisionase family DNA binding protein
MLGLMPIPMTTAQVCERLNTDRKTVRRLIRNGELRAEKLPGRTGAYLFRAEDVEAVAIQRECDRFVAR